MACVARADRYTPRKGKRWELWLYNRPQTARLQRQATRHGAMQAAEAGADYVMFGEPDQRQHRPSFDAVIERVSWWAELFEIPCVGFAGGIEEVAPLADAGAEFIALGDWIFDYPQGAALAVAEAASRVAPVEAAG